MHAGEVGPVQPTESVRNLSRSSVVLRPVAVFFIGLSISILLLSGCSKPIRPEVAYQHAADEFESGDLPHALTDARAGSASFRSQPEWAAKFTLLEAEVLIWQGQYKNAQALLGQAVPPTASGALIVRQKALQSMANTFLQNFDLADRLAREAEELAVAGAPNLLPDVYLSRGVLNMKMGDYAQAEQVYSHMLQLARAQNREFLVLAGLGNLGILNVKQQHYDNAIDLFSAVKDSGERRHNSLQLVKTNFNLGWCFLKLGNYDKALEYYTQAESLAAKNGMAKNQLEALSSIGEVYMEQQDGAGAEPFLQRALTISRSLGDKSSVAMILNNLAIISVSQHKLDAAERYNNESLELETATHDRQWLNNVRETGAHIQQARGNLAKAEKALSQVIGDSASDASLRWESETRLAEVYAAQHRDLAAEAQYRRALATVDAARAALASEELRISFLTTASDFYNSYIDFLVAHGRARDALQVAEHSRARTLSEGLRLSGGTRKVPFSPELAARRAHGVVLAYWLKNGHSYLWAVTPQKVEVFALPPAEQIETEVHAYSKEVLGPRDVLETANVRGQQLYSMLVAPAKKHIARGSRVTVVADGVLHTLNFETLLAPGPQLHYWIEDVELTNSPSLDLLAASETSRKLVKQRLLLIGNPLAASADFPRLAQAKLEIETVEKSFTPLQCTALEGGQATVRAYLSSNPGSYSHIHFGTHGTASRVAPLESSIILSPEGDAYKLYAREITSHPLRADLVTISACYGAGTRAYTGEGLVGLSWAFLRAGARNVVAALWEVDDASTPQLMGAMYKKLREGSSPAEALRSAKLQMVHSQSVYRRPYYWGAFQCYAATKNNK